MKRRRDPKCECGEAEESPEHILKNCQIYAAGRPPELKVNENETREYIRKTIQLLWEAERAKTRKKIQKVLS